MNPLMSSPDVEKRWRNEFVEMWKNRLREPDFLRALVCLKQARAGEALPEIVAAADCQSDGYALLQFAEAIWEIAPAGSATAPERARAVRKMREIYRRLAEQPFEISEENRRLVACDCRASAVSTPEEYIKKRAAEMFVRCV